MPMQWNDQADARLFANVLKLHVVKLDYPALAKAMGNGVTPKAISHRISKIKEKAQAYRRDHPYAFGPDIVASPVSKRNRNAGAKATSAKDLFQLEDDQSEATVKPEAGGDFVKVENDFYENNSTSFPQYGEYQLPTPAYSFTPVEQGSLTVPEPVPSFESAAPEPNTKEETPMETE